MFSISGLITNTVKSGCQMALLQGVKLTILDSLIDTPFEGAGR